MSLMTVRHKPFRSFVWLTCFLTFYLGFNQQVMCFELDPNGKAHNAHLQLIECNPLSSFIFPDNHLPGMMMPDALSVNASNNGCPKCRDFHLSFKRNPNIDFSALGAIISLLPFKYQFLPNELFLGATSQNEQIGRVSQTLVPKSYSSLKFLRTTILRL